MALYSTNGAVAINQTLPPNVSPFGWTSSDLKSVTDIVRWVEEAQNAAENANEHSNYVKDGLDYVNAVHTEISNMKDAVSADKTSVIASQTDVTNKISSAIAEIQAYQTAVFAAMAYSGKLFQTIKDAFPNITFPDPGTPPTPHTPAP